MIFNKNLKERKKERQQSTILGTTLILTSIFIYPILAIKYYSIFYYNFEFTCVEFVLVSPVEFTKGKMGGILNREACQVLSKA